MRRSLLLLFLLPAALLGQPKWDPLSPQDLASPPPPVDPSAPAEAIFRRISVDDSDFPAERRIHTYVRYRIFDPERAVSITRLALPSVSLDGVRSARVTVDARLLLPDGQIKVFGSDAMRERTVVESATEKSWFSRLFSSGLEVRERYLAITGIVPGSILELQFDSTDSNPARMLDWVLQQPEYPDRRLAFSYRASNSSEWTFGRYVLNTGPVRARAETDDRHRRLVLTVDNLAALTSEPVSGVPADHALTFIAVYEPANGRVLNVYNTAQHFDLNLRRYPWSAYASECYLIELDRIDQTGRIRRLAAQITARAESPEAKARAIHDWVQDLYLRYSHRLRRSGQFDAVRNIDDLTEIDSNPRLVASTNDFIALEVGLDRIVGLDAHTVMLPRRSQIPFSQQMVGPAFLPVLAARVHVGNEWKFSDPVTDTHYAFGALPWESEGYVALVAGPGQEFVPVPLSPPEFSQVVDSGTFALHANGDLTGQGARILTGHLAEIARYQLRNADATAQKAHFRRQLQADLKGADVAVDEITGLYDPYRPLRVAYHLTWPGYAERTNTRLVFHPGVFHGDRASPFTDGPRHSAFRFPYAWQEHDRAILSLPDGYTLETREMPPSLPNRALDYRCGIAQEAGNGRIHYSRDFTSRLAVVPASAARAIYAIYDAIAARDRFELVAVRHAAARTTDTGEAP